MSQALDQHTTSFEQTYLASPQGYHNAQFVEHLRCSG
jgi:hypothetical protein